MALLIIKFPTRKMLSWNWLCGLVAEAFVGALLTLSGFSTPAAQQYDPYHVKAVFLFNFAQFVEWPAQTFPREDSPLIIGVLGDNPFGTALDEAVRNEKINKHPLQVTYLSDLRSARQCHILFVGTSNPSRLRAIFADLKGRSILTVGESENFLGNGGMIRFVTENKVRLQANPKAARQAGLKISSKLLRVAEVVNND